MQTEQNGRVINVNHKSSKRQRRPRVYLGRIVDKKSGKVITEGTPVVGKLATPHPLHGHLKKIVVVKIPAAGGYYMQRMKLKTALQKGYYKVNTTDPKTKAAIEKALEPYQKEPVESSGDSHIDSMRELQEIIKMKTPNA